ncbi:MAG: DUF4263 domain-containing protein, partial [Thaumarchaeota archaeon]|nr:DUF4263 domain-containing protein [Nitrososphaerota archaeon]
MPSILNKSKFDSKICRSELNQFKKLLDEKQDLRERKDIQKNFKEWTHLSMYIASYNPRVSEFNRYKHEYDIGGKFRCDLIAGDGSNNAYCLIEFEATGKEYIFAPKVPSKYTRDWSSDFEHGFSQIIDWFWLLDTSQHALNMFSPPFNKEGVCYCGILIIGRDNDLKPKEDEAEEHNSQEEMKARLEWRHDKVIVNSKKILCITYD